MALLPLMASASVKVDGIYYKLNTGTKQAEVTSGEAKYTGSVTIPETFIYEGVTYSVTEIGSSAFYYCSKLTSVTIPNSVTSIGGMAFYKCTSLTAVTIPNSVTSIGDMAFWYCSGLTAVTIPNSVTEIGYAFSHCSSLASIAVESGNKRYDSRNNCNAIIESASNTLISGCNNTIIPNSVTSIGDFAFSDCSGLTSMTIPNSVTSIGVFAFSGCSGLTSVTIPNNVTSIGEGAFEECSGLTEVTIPNSVTSIGWSAFRNCSGLTEVYCYAENVPTTTDNSFENSNNATLYVPEASVEAYKTTAPWSGFGNIFALGDKPVTGDVAINATNFPDENFRNWVLSQSYGSDGVLTTAEIADVTSINVSGTYSSPGNITNLKGIEFFTALTKLYCYHNQLTSLNVSKNTALTTLYCYDNQLTSLDVSGCTALLSLDCIGNQITSLDMSKNTALTALYCFSNQITSLDVSKNTKLTTLWCYGNQIKGAAMDALVESLPTVSGGDMYVICNENESNVMTTTQVAAAKAKGWTPRYYTGSNWQEYAGSEPEVKKCATPIIAYFNDKLIIRCATEGVKYVCNLGFETDNDLSLPSKVKISLYATKDGYEPSDTITQEIDPRLLLGKIGDVNGDGEVGMSDVMYLVQKILNGKFPDE